MIRIEYTEQGDQFWLEARGHADSNEYGHDVVCSAVSMLLQALQIRLEEITGHKHYVNRVERGGATLHGFGAEQMEAAQTVMCGLRKVAAEAPAFVEIAEEHL